MNDSVPSKLWRISTQWSKISDPTHFFIRYAAAVRQYLGVLLRNRNDADDVTQELLVQVTDRGFEHADPDRGRFRDYLIVIVRNAALQYRRRQSQRPEFSNAETGIQFEQAASDEAERVWLDEWHRCLLDRAWRSLHAFEVKSGKSYYFSILRLTVDHPEEDQSKLLELFNQTKQTTLGFDAFRKQLSRARRLFAERLVQEVAQTLNQPTPDEVEAELIDLGLFQVISDFLPSDWKEQTSMFLPIAPNDFPEMIGYSDAGEV
jgi:RNA polymerase sigma factor (sigma-70 family)